MGLGALYLLHLLAQDYMKIRKPAAKLAKFLLSKRDLDAVRLCLLFFFQLEVQQKCNIFRWFYIIINIMVFYR